MKSQGLHRREGRPLLVCPGVAALLAVLACLTFGSGRAAEVQVIPPYPTTDDAIVLVLSGTWKDSCVPGAPKVMILGSQITITTSNPSEMCLMVLTPWQLTVPIGGLSSPGWYTVVVVHNGQPIGGKEFEVRKGEDGFLPPVTISPITGTTDGEGRFTVPLPWPGTTASGKLLGPDGRPLARRSFALTPVPKGAALVSPEDIAGFTFHVPGYAKTTVTKFSMFSLFGLTSFLLGDVQLAAVELPWSAGRPLTWDDFQGDPPEGAERNREAAWISMWLGYSPEARTWLDRGSGKWKAHLTSVTTTNTMDRSQSWVAQNARTPGLLNHEQKHFDLNEVYRRLLDAALQRLVCNLETMGNTEQEAMNNLRAELGRVYNRFDAKCEEMQRQYDSETDHGRNADKQSEWNRKISDWLADPSTAPQP